MFPEKVSLASIQNDGVYSFACVSPRHLGICRSHSSLQCLFGWPGDMRSAAWMQHHALGLLCDASMLLWLPRSNEVFHVSWYKIQRLFAKALALLCILLGPCDLFHLPSHVDREDRWTPGRYPHSIWRRPVDLRWLICSKVHLIKIL